MTGDAQPHPGIRPTIDDLDMPVHSEPVDQGIGDDCAHAVHRGELLSSRRPNGVDRAEIGGKRTGRHRTNVTDAEANENTPQVFGFCEFELGQQLAGSRGRHRFFVASEL